MRWQIGWQGAAIAIVLLEFGLVVGSYRHTAEPVHSTVEERSRPADAVALRVNPRPAERYTCLSIRCCFSVFRTVRTPPIWR